MKKTLSILLSAVMLVCSVSVSFNAFAYTKSKAPTVNLGESFEVNVKHTSVYKLMRMDEDDYLKSDFYQAKFVPESDGYYEFIFDTDYVESGEEAILFGFISDDEGEYVNFAICRVPSEEEKKLYRDYGIEVSVNPTMSSKLEAGKPYYLMMINTGSNTYTSNVVINKHTHNKYDDMLPSYVDSEDFEYNTDGAYYTGCDKNNCDYYKVNKRIYSVKSVSLSHSSYTYNGKEKKPTVTIKDRKGNIVSKNNYTVKYSNNKKVGTGKVKITFKNEYEGTYTKTFRIIPQSTSLSGVTAKKKGFTAKWKKQATQTTGYQLQYATDKNFKNNRKTLTISGTKNTSKTISKLSAKKKYYVRVRTYKTINGTTYYSSWSKAKTVTTKK